MWPFSRHTTIEKSRMLGGFTDWHSHILPGVDDGVPTLQESLEILDAYEAMGVKRIWLTPHIMEDVPNSPEDLRDRYEALSAAYQGPIELRLAAENMIDPLFEERLESGNLLPIGDSGEHLLVETSYMNAPMRFRELLREIKRKGYFPVLAHPERYRYMDADFYKELKEEDIKFQMNLFSLTGIYGREAAHKGEWLLRQGFIDILGSDIHKASMLRFFRQPIAAGKTMKAFAALSKPINQPT